MFAYTYWLEEAPEPGCCQLTGGPLTGRHVFSTEAEAIEFARQNAGDNPHIVRKRIGVAAWSLVHSTVPKSLAF
jgi:hypothetical protein